MSRSPRSNICGPQRLKIVLKQGQRCNRAPSQGLVGALLDEFETSRHLEAGWHLVVSEGGVDVGSQPVPGPPCAWSTYNNHPSALAAVPPPASRTVSTLPIRSSSLRLPFIVARRDERFDSPRRFPSESRPILRRRAKEMSDSACGSRLTD